MSETGTSSTARREIAPAAVTPPWGATRVPAGRPGTDDTLPAGAAWDLLLHAAAHRLPLSLRLGGAPAVAWSGTLAAVRLQGHALRVDAGPWCLWLDERSPVGLDLGAQAAASHSGLVIGPVPGASRAQQCAWRRLATQLRQGLDPEGAPCSC